MRFMVIVKATQESEAGVMPSEQLLTEMGRFNEELAKAGVMLAGEGLQPSSKGARVRFSGSQRIVTDGPFPETKELIAGFWLWQGRSEEEAIEWLERAPFDGGTEGEGRPDFPAEGQNQIMHARLVAGDAVLMGSDCGSQPYEQPRGIHVSLHVDHPAEAERIFHAFADGGTVLMPIQETFWAVRFGMVTDRFGTP